MSTESCLNLFTYSISVQDGRPIDRLVKMTVVLKHMQHECVNHFVLLKVCLCVLLDFLHSSNITAFKVHFSHPELDHMSGQQGFSENFRYRWRLGKTLTTVVYIQRTVGV